MTNPTTVINKEWFKPSELAKYNLITNSKGKGDYRYVLKLIKNGKLKARDWSSTGNKPYWLVHWTEITNYNNELANKYGYYSGPNPTKGQEVMTNKKGIL